MKFKPYIITAHALVWILLLVIPTVTTYQVLTSFIPSAEHITLKPMFLMSLVLIMFFYFHYYLLIPKYLLRKKYGLYFLLLLSSVVFAFTFSGFIFYLWDFNPEKIISINPSLQKINPLVHTNAFLMWVLALVTSGLLAVNNRLIQTQNEKYFAQIASLKSQINPHFLFNTLNNIYATAIDSSPDAAEMIGRLSEMMRYTMKDTRQDYVPLEDEINYINNYIELQKIRLDSGVKLEYKSLEHIPALQIAPMLLIPFIENVFKHGVNSEQHSRVIIRMTLSDNEFCLFTYNAKVETQNDIRESSGLGIENTKLRLQLIYPSEHVLQILDNEDRFQVTLKIQLDDKSYSN